MQEVKKSKKATKTFDENIKSFPGLFEKVENLNFLKTAVKRHEGYFLIFWQREIN